MRLPRTILACTDFSNGGNEAVAYAIELAAALHSDLVLAHFFNGFVVMQHELLRSPDAAEIESRRLGGLARLQELARNLSHGGVAIRCVCEHGDPRTGIPRLAQHERAELIVIGRYGQSGVGRLFVGSVADAIVRNASAPVLAVGEAGPVGAHVDGNLRWDARRA
jgi:nucleotide-binding universal stress UspA family protein